MAVSHVIEVYSKDHEFLGFFNNAMNRKYSEEINKPSLFEFSLDLNDLKATDELLAGGENYIKYKRDGVLKWSGEIAEITESLTESEEKINIVCRDWFSLLADRYITAETTYSSTNEGEILFAIIDEAQSISDGGMGIVNNANSSATTRTITYKDYNIQQAFIDMSELENGIDFEITPNRILNIYESKGEDLSATHVFKYTQNIKAFTRKRSWVSLKNDIKGYGKDSIESTADDTGSQNTYRRRQSIESFTNDELTATLNNHLNEVLRTNAGPIYTYTLSLLPDSNPQFGTYALGDTVTLQVQRGSIDVDTTVRVYGWNVSIDEDNVEDIQLTVSTV